MHPDNAITSAGLPAIPSIDLAAFLEGVLVSWSSKITVYLGTSSTTPGRQSVLFSTCRSTRS
jgi:hypothetical protein